MNAATTDACMEILDKAEMREPVLSSLLDAIQLHLDRRAAGAFRVGAVLFSNQYGPLGQTRTAKELLDEWKTDRHFLRRQRRPGRPGAHDPAGCPPPRKLPGHRRAPDPEGRDAGAGHRKGAVELSGKTILPLRFAMSLDPAVQKAAHIEAARAVKEYLDAGRDVAMLNLGDLSVYATFGYLQEILETEGCKTVMLPGVTSFCAAAARLGQSLTGGMEQPLTIARGAAPLRCWPHRAQKC